MDGFPGTERAELRRLARELADLRRQLAALSGAGVSTAHGAPVVRTTQLGFEAELTAAWGASAGVGYAWKRLRLDGAAAPVAFGNPGVQPTGAGAIAANGATTYPAGTRGWMEPSPDGTGYVFIPDAATPFHALLSEATDEADWTGRTLSAGSPPAWTNDTAAGADNATPVQVDGPGTAFTAKPTAPALMWPSKAAGKFEYLPLQYADEVAGVGHAGFLSHGVQVVGGAKTWKGQASFLGGVQAQCNVLQTTGYTSDLSYLTVREGFTATNSASGGWRVTFPQGFTWNGSSKYGLEIALDGSPANVSRVWVEEYRPGTGNRALWVYDNLRIGNYAGAVHGYRVGGDGNGLDEVGAGSGTVGVTYYGLRFRGGLLVQASTAGAIVLTTDVSGTLPLANGGTGATTAAGARTNLDVYSKAETDALVAAAIAGQPTAAAVNSIDFGAQTYTTITVRVP